MIVSPIKSHLFIKYFYHKCWKGEYSEQPTCLNRQQSCFVPGGSLHCEAGRDFFHVQCPGHAVAQSFARLPQAAGSGHQVCLSVSASFQFDGPQESAPENPAALLLDVQEAKRTWSAAVSILWLGTCPLKQ